MSSPVLINVTLEKADVKSHIQRWEETKHQYFVTTLKKIFQVFVFYLSIYFSDVFLLLLPTF